MIHLTDSQPALQRAAGEIGPPCCCNEHPKDCSCGSEWAFNVGTGPQSAKAHADKLTVSESQPMLSLPHAHIAAAAPLQPSWRRPVHLLPVLACGVQGKLKHMELGTIPDSRQPRPSNLNPDQMLSLHAVLYLKSRTWCSCWHRSRARLQAESLSRRAVGAGSCPAGAPGELSASTCSS